MPPTGFAPPVQSCSPHSLVPFTTRPGSSGRRRYSVGIPSPRSRSATRFLGVGGAKGENRPQAGKKCSPPPLGGGKFSVLPPPCGGGQNIFLHLPNCTSVKDCDVINQYILQQLIDNVLNFYYSSSNFIIQLYTFLIWICALSIWTGFIQLLQAYNMKISVAPKVRCFAVFSNGKFAGT